MFARFRKPTPKKQTHLLNLTPLESRDVPAMWHITMVSSNAGDTDATISGSLYVGSADIEANSAADAIARSLAGDVMVTYLGQMHTYHFGENSATGQHSPFQIDVNGENAALRFEDLAQMPGYNADFDYNDHSWNLTVTSASSSGSGSGSGGESGSGSGSDSGSGSGWGGGSGSGAVR